MTSAPLYSKTQKPKRERGLVVGRRFERGPGGFWFSLRLVALRTGRAPRLFADAAVQQPNFGLSKVRFQTRGRRRAEPQRKALAWAGNAFLGVAAARSNRDRFRRRPRRPANQTSAKLTPVGEATFAPRAQVF